MLYRKFAALAVAAMLANTGAAALADAGTAKPAKKTNSDLVCKKFPVTGSLIDSRRICKTPAEWRNDEERIRQMNETNNCSANFGAACNGG